MQRPQFPHSISQMLRLATPLDVIWTQTEPPAMGEEPLWWRQEVLALAVVEYDDPELGCHIMPVVLSDDTQFEVLDPDLLHDEGSVAAIVRQCTTDVMCLEAARRYHDEIARFEADEAATFQKPETASA
jgi:hypothetical protein